MTDVTYDELDHLSAAEVLAVMFSLDQGFIDMWTAEQWDADDRPMPEVLV